MPSYIEKVEIWSGVNVPESQTFKDRATPFLRSQEWSSRNAILQLSTGYVHLSTNFLCLVGGVCDNRR